MWSSGGGTAVVFYVVALSKIVEKAQKRTAEWRKNALEMGFGWVNLTTFSRNPTNSFKTALSPCPCLLRPEPTSSFLPRHTLSLHRFLWVHRFLRKSLSRSLQRSLQRSLRRSLWVPGFLWNREAQLGSMVWHPDSWVA